MSNRIISIWGDPFSGKTTFSVKLAKELSAKKKNVIVLFPDLFCPTMNIILPGHAEKKSLGNILSATIIDEDIILKNSIYLEKNNYISLLGYRERENITTYPEYGENKVKDLIRNMLQITDYIIIDCSSHFVVDLISSISLEISDIVIRLMSPTLKSISYFDSNTPLLIDKRFNFEKHIKILSNFKSDDSIEIVKDRYDIKYELPYTDELRNQMMGGELFYNLKSKKSYLYNDTVRKLTSVILNENKEVKGFKLWRK
ncbi:ParA family protein [Clostridioides difficile]|uniref:ParA family protein n=1 Tax=Clostridioides difficile TaxID=1496 RepID=UPI001C13BDBE|nr:ParA family protein [Clostridioides difficile]EKJ1811806.1 ParA family protein [Clostridioides difficile]MBZ0658201.1 ParA family protein [Clostridioides difficile]MCP8337807.1 ParA family protein [Clostridioides difficile]MCP8365834.1 ParA family protein [Clostridioides difficile]MCP8383291.1 ParA family protein [Clostridioides difficile]